MTDELVPFGGRDYVVLCLLLFIVRTSLEYAWYLYDEPSSAHANDYVAHGSSRWRGSSGTSFFADWPCRRSVASFAQR